MSNILTSNFKLPTSTVGITLIALIIIIIVLLILAGVTLTAVIGSNGIITKAQKAREETQIKTAQEELELILTEAKTTIISENRDLSVPEVANEIKNTKDEKIEMIITYMPEAKVTIESSEVTDNRRSVRTNPPCRNRL